MSDRRFEEKEHASHYASFRYSPPKSSIDKILRYLGEQINPPYKKVLDVGCGTGQSSLVWRPYFKNIIGTDVSPAQIKEAQERNEFNNVNYNVCPAERITLPDNSVELISVVAALHWFQIEEFFKEAKRLLITNGVLAVQGYHSVRIKFNTDEKTHLANIAIKQLYDNLREFWSPRVKIARNEFSSINFPFDDMVRYSGIKNDIEVTVDKVIGFIISYSSYQTLKKTTPEKAEYIIKELRERLLELAGSENETFVLEMNHFLILCRNK